MKCRHCGSALTVTMVDLGSAPPSNAYLTAERMSQPEQRYPLKVLVCDNCWLAQTADFARAEELFDDSYAYFSGFSTTWLAHAKQFVVEMVRRFGLTTSSHVIEVAANDGYLLQYVREHRIPCTGIEPTASTADVARAKGIPIVQEFFSAALGERLADEGQTADLLVANNVLAHVPDINDFVAGFARLLKPDGVATFEFPHLFRLIDENQFDTIYHEHYSYLSFTVTDRILAANGLTIFDVQELPTHGGSLRVFAQRRDAGHRERCPSVADMLGRERAVGMTTVDFYKGFQAKADKVRDDFVAFLQDTKRRGGTVAAYGAAAKGNTLMNYAKVGTDLIPFVVDRNPAKQQKFMPGSRIPIVSESRLVEEKPEFILILPWNLRTELRRKLEYVKAWGGKLVTAVPRLQVDS